MKTTEKLEKISNASLMEVNGGAVTSPAIVPVKMLIEKLRKLFFKAYEIQEGIIKYMKELCNMELFEVDGGKKYKCTYCGYTSSSTSKMALHFGIKTWHYLLGASCII